MRLWHYKLIHRLPEEQLIGQWRECCLIAKKIAQDGTPNHLLVNPVTAYSESEFIQYCKIVYGEMLYRNYRPDASRLVQYFSHAGQKEWNNLPYQLAPYQKIFEHWHTDRYMEQCYRNLEEKYDRGGISEDEWRYVCDAFTSEDRN